ncbi:hypothetical protein NIES23_44340 [Trichormus variabilis NIES-23]|uniref:Uncharacterized protein n=1 Tax=Trichormus variabilis NIES-23 TaxID=1973479 RepID=A0A1Z4KRP1_ANAVA|nr:hypothetical protein NIES23_44340 [Trichormus variabilis NIES-23]
MTVLIAQRLIATGFIRAKRPATANSTVLSKCIRRWLEAAQTVRHPLPVFLKKDTAE